jgi:hippurate hydrolase
MPVINRIADFAEEMAGWRRHLHMHPELSFDCTETAAFVVERLRGFGVDEIHEGIATSGVVALIRGRGPGPVIGLRAAHRGADGGGACLGPAGADACLRP